MNTAKQNFQQFIYVNQQMPEANKLQCEQKMAALETSRISYAVWWTLFWMLMVGPIGLIFSLFLNVTNYSKRTNYKDVEMMRVQMKINNFIKYETPQLTKNSDPKAIDKPQAIIEQKKPTPIVYPVTRQLDFNNISKDKIIEILKLSNISFKEKDNIFQLGEKANANKIAWKKVPETLIKEVLDANGITYKLNITKDDMIKLLK